MNLFVFNLSVLWLKNASLTLTQFSVNVYNPLARPVTWPVRLPVNGTAYVVSDANGKSVDSQVSFCVCFKTLKHFFALNKYMKLAAPLCLRSRWFQCPQPPGRWGGAEASPSTSWCSRCRRLLWATPPTPCPCFRTGLHLRPHSTAHPQPSRTRSLTIVLPHMNMWNKYIMIYRQQSKETAWKLTKCLSVCSSSYKWPLTPTPASWAASATWRPNRPSNWRRTSTG